MWRSITVEEREWKHPSPSGTPDYRGQMRWVVLDCTMVVDHFATEAEANEAADYYATNI